MLGKLAGRCWFDEGEGYESLLSISAVVVDGQRGGKADRNPIAREDAVHLKVEILLRRIGDVWKGAGYLNRRAQGRAFIQ